MRIDSHHHFWKFSNAEFGWIDDSMAVLRRDHLPAELAQEMAKAGVDGAVSVQARQTLEETRWLLDLADSHDFIKAVTGWAPIASPDFEKIMEPFLSRRKLRGLRHVVQDEAPGFLDGSDFNRGIGRLKAMNLTYDMLILERQLEEAIRFVDRHPDQTFVVDHIAKPRIKDGIIKPWRRHMAELAKRPNVYCKLSGMVTEADYSNWTEEQLKPYFDGALQTFGPGRLMLGSDWPVCRVGITYQRWFEILGAVISRFSPDERAAMESRNAVTAYGLDV